MSFVYGGGSVKKNGCYDDVKKAVEIIMLPVSLGMYLKTLKNLKQKS